MRTVARGSFAELESRSDAVAGGLVSIGVRPGDRVTLYGPNCREWVVAYYATAKGGAGFDAATVLAAVTEHRATMMDGVPTAYYYLLAHPDFDRADLSSLS